jgi:hypothetical protein
MNIPLSKKTPKKPGVYLFRQYNSDYVQRITVIETDGPYLMGDGVIKNLTVNEHGGKPVTQMVGDFSEILTFN